MLICGLAATTWAVLFRALIPYPGTMLTLALLCIACVCAALPYRWTEWKSLLRDNAAMLGLTIAILLLMLLHSESIAGTLRLPKFQTSLLALPVLLIGLAMGATPIYLHRFFALCCWVMVPVLLLWLVATVRYPITYADHYNYRISGMLFLFVYGYAETIAPVRFRPFTYLALFGLCVYGSITALLALGGIQVVQLIRRFCLRNVMLGLASVVLCFWAVYTAYASPAQRIVFKVQDHIIHGFGIHLGIRAPIPQFGTQDCREERPQLYAHALDMFRDNPLIGQGTASYHTCSALYPHNLFLEFMAEHGVIGLALVLALCGIVIGRLLRRSQGDVRAFGFYLLLTVFLLVMLSGEGLQRLLLFVFGLLGGMTARTERI